jgi:hypothetical protein
VLYCSGASATALQALAAAGLRIKILPGEIGAASALKMAYAGITKGLTALASTMMLGASRNGVADALYAELADSQPNLLRQFSRSVPDMYGKAYRWVAEMHEIAGFLDPDASGRQLFDSAAQVYQRLAQDHRAEQAETGALTAFLAQGEGKAGV